MLRINQFAKDLGVTNHDVIDALEKRLGISGKSHSSNLTDDQVSQLRRVFEAKSKGMEEGTPLALHKPSAPVRIVKAVPQPHEPGQPPVLVKAPEVQAEAYRPAPEPVQASVPEPLPAPAPRISPAEPTAVAVPAQPAQPSVPAAARPNPAPARLEPRPPAQPARSEFSRLRVSAPPTPSPKSQEPARYIQLPPPHPAKGRPEAGARPVVQRPGQAQPNVQRSGQPQPERTTLPMASNTGKGEVRHEQNPSAPQQGSRRPYIPPSISSLQPEQGFTRIKMADAPTPAPRSTEPARYIQLPQARPAGQRPGGPG
ncbi:MAG TPA: translation initiation factor IF-2 N-terminal domain-containing protein, partial [Holophaga sp.]|nr:translation initiation factor IF-2 N-terminal domain-containing protein [Holophaga sp.]